MNNSKILASFDYDELDDLFDYAFPPANIRPNPDQRNDSVLLDFLNACLNNMGWSYQTLADALSTDVQLIHAIFNGVLPLPEIQGDLLEELAYAIGYEPIILQMLLEYDTPSNELTEIVGNLIDEAISGSLFRPGKSRIKSQAQELEQLHEELARLLIEAFGGYYDAELRKNAKQQMIYQTFIDKIKSILTNYQSDIEQIQTTISQIKENYQAAIQTVQMLKATREFEEYMHKGAATDYETIEIRDREDIEG